MLAVLVIIDGFGFNPKAEGNAIFAAKTPNLDWLWSNYPHTLIKAAEEEVGLAFGQIGNSEVGHMAIGTGRVIPSPLQRINLSIMDRSFFQNPAFLAAVKHVKTYHSRLHVIGLMSSSGVHGDVAHLNAILQLAKDQGVTQVYVHPILDGRDTGPKEAPIHLSRMESKIKSLGLGEIATISGRAYAMDRSQNWARTQAYYEAIIGASPTIMKTDAEQTILAYYHDGFDDESIPPTILNPEGAIRSSDAVIITNFREDRMRQIASVLSDTEFPAFRRGSNPQNTLVVTMTDYGKGHGVEVAFPRLVISNTLSDVVEENGMRQLHVSETEKSAHITYFLNGGREARLPHEEYVSLHSDPPERFVEHPQMQAEAITRVVLKSIADKAHDCIFVNFANPDMIGHTGDFAKTVIAVETVDLCVGAIARSVFGDGGSLFITADHGNAEFKVDLTNKTRVKDHTINPVPVLFAKKGKETPGAQTKITYGATVTGILQDVAPTFLTQLDLPVPPEMIGTNLFSQ